MRTIIVADIHGCHSELLALLKKLKFREDTDRLICLGDLIDRGNQVYEVFDYVRTLKPDMGERCVLIRGNHEQMLMDSVDDRFSRQMWFMNGGAETVRSFKKHRQDYARHINWFGRMPLYFETKDFICAHAGVRTDRMAENTADILLWDRDSAKGNGYSGKIAMVGHTPVIDPVYLDGKGHTEVIEDRKPQMLPSWGTICMDTGCVFGYRLTGMVIEDGMFYTDSVFWGVDG